MEINEKKCIAKIDSALRSVSAVHSAFMDSDKDDVNDAIVALEVALNALSEAMDRVSDLALP